MGKQHQEARPLPPGWGYAADGVTLTNFEGKTIEQVEAEEEATRAVAAARVKVAQIQAAIAERIAANLRAHP